MISGRSRIDVDRRAVSETLGYILVFSIIVTTIATATVFGFTGLEDRQAAEQVTNVERAFDVLADNFADISRYEDPSRATEVRLAGGTVGFDDPVTITVGQWDPDSETFVDGERKNVTFQPLVFQSDGGEVIYESGVVFRGSQSRSIARSPLPFVVGEETALVPVTATSQRSTTTAVGGEQTTLIVGERRPNTRTLANRTVKIDENSDNKLAVRIESARADGWERQLRQDGYQNISTDPGQVTAELAVEKNGTVHRPQRVRLPVTHITVRFD